MVIDIEPTVEQKVVSGEEIKAKIAELYPDKKVFSSYHFSTEMSEDGILLIKTFLATQPQNVPPFPELAEAIKQSTNLLGVYYVEIVGYDRKPVAKAPTRMPSPTADFVAEPQSRPGRIIRNPSTGEEYTYNRDK